MSGNGGQSCIHYVCVSEIVCSQELSVFGVKQSILHYRGTFIQRYSASVFTTSLMLVCQPHIQGLESIAFPGWISML